MPEAVVAPPASVGMAGRCAALLVAVLGAGAAGLSLEPVVWHTGNRRFLAAGGYVLYPQIGDRLDLVCPGAGGAGGGYEYYKLYLVGGAQARRCQVPPAPTLLLTCDRPQRDVRFTIKFQEFSPNLWGHEFRRLHDYYIITTSDGTPEGLENRQGGACLTRAMRVTLRVGQREWGEGWGSHPGGVGGHPWVPSLTPPPPPGPGSATEQEGAGTGWGVGGVGGGPGYLGPPDPPSPPLRPGQSDEPPPRSRPAPSAGEGGGGRGGGRGGGAAGLGGGRGGFVVATSSSTTPQNPPGAAPPPPHLPRPRLPPPRPAPPRRPPRLLQGMRGGEGRAKGGAKTGGDTPLPQPQGGSAPSGMGGDPQKWGDSPQNGGHTHTHTPPPGASRPGGKGLIPDTGGAGPSRGGGAYLKGVA
uniref:Ephrin B3 n=1 Tax=Accipiter nisus TaxID=211598 RepID=A0A8B9N8W7_9AVES